MNTEINNKIKFLVHQPTEFLYCMLKVTFSDSKENDSEYFIPNITDEYLGKINTLKSKLSKFLKKELDFFFDNSAENVMGCGYIIFFGIIVNNPTLNTMEDFLGKYVETDALKMFGDMAKTVIERNCSKEINEICPWEKTKSNFGEILKLVEETSIKDSDFKEKLMECLMNPAEAKERFYFVLKQFWAIAYDFILDSVKKYSDTYMTRYQKLFLNNSSDFLKKYLNTKAVQQEEVFIVISYFKYLSCDTWSSGEKSIIWCSLGAFTENFIENPQSEEDIEKFFKALSDKNRLNIIRLLTKEDLYVYELAERLNMTAATISYHLSLLVGLKIVQFERYDHRIYYSLNKGRLEELAKSSIENLLNMP